jgi:hypothetical protein
LIAEIPNVITTDGKKIITRFLAKNNNAWAGAMCVGSGRTSPVVGDKTLNFEYARFPVYYSYGFFDTTYKIIFKAMMPENFAGAIEEIGMYSQMTNLNSTTYDSPFNLFDNVNDWTATGVTVTEQPSIATITSSATATRIKTGTAGYSVAGTGNLYRDFSHVNFSEYALTDSFALGYGLNGSAATTAIRFEKDASNYYAATAVTGGTLNENNITTFTKSSMTPTGSLSWSDVVGIRIVITSNAGGVYLDGLRPVVINHYNEDYALVSRAISGSEDSLIKRAGSRLDLEYEVTVNL